MSDFEFLQYALVLKSNVSAALRRIKKLQSFKQRYGIKLDGSYEEGVRDLKVFQTVRPGFLLSIKAMPDQTHVCCYDLSKFEPQKMESNESFAVIMRGFSI